MTNSTETTDEIHSILSEGANKLTPHDVKRLLHLYSQQNLSIDLELDTTDIQSVLDGNRIAIDEIIAGLEAGEYGLLTSPGGVGKSYLMLLAAVHMALGMPILGGILGPARPGGQKVIYLSLEDRPSTRVHNRLLDILSYLQINRAHPLADQLTRNLTICNSSSLVPGITRGLPVDPDNPPRLVIIDTFRSFAPEAEENQAKETTQVIKSAQEHAKLYGAAILILHHVNKAALGNHSRSESTAGQVRGSSSLQDNARAAWTLWPPTPSDVKNHNLSASDSRNVVILKSSKANHGPGANEQWFRKNSAGVPCPIETPRAQSPARTQTQAGNPECTTAQPPSPPSRMPGRFLPDPT